MNWIEPDWPAPGNVRALSTTRDGGLSEGVFAGLNLGAHVWDEPARVEANRAQAYELGWLIRRSDPRPASTVPLPYRGRLSLLTDDGEVHPVARLNS